MEWRDEGVVLAARKHGERDAVLSLLTFRHGRHAGLVKGGAGKRAAPLVQPGNRLECVWRARIPEHLGLYTLEPVRLYVATMLDDPARLAAVASAAALVDAALPERDPHPDLFAALVTLLGRIAGADPRAPPEAWAADYVRFELMLLAELGYGLDLDACAVTGVTEGLAYVSPRTGRAVSPEGAGIYRERLLPLPPFLRGEGAADAQQVADGLRLAGHFLRRHIFEATDRPVPVARDRLVDLLRRRVDPPSDTSPDPDTDPASDRTA